MTIVLLFVIFFTINFFLIIPLDFSMFNKFKIKNKSLDIYYKKNKILAKLFLIIILTILVTLITTIIINLKYNV